jgi:hypothetical protein
VPPKTGRERSVAPHGIEANHGDLRWLPQAAGPDLPSAAYAATQEVSEPIQPVEIYGMTHALNLALAALAAALLTGCGTLSKDDALAAERPISQPPANPGVAEEARFDPKIVSLPFRMDVTFSEGALAKLRETNADLGVSADYYGAPKDPGMPGLDPDLGVWLGGEMETIDPGERSLTLKGQIDAARVAREVSGDARVRVMVFPVRAYSSQAGVTCTEFDEYLSIAVETGGTVRCTLVGE